MSKKQSQEYKGNGEHRWEPAADGTMRLRVPGGWLYRVKMLGELSNLAFVPMPEVVKHKV